LCYSGFSTDQEKIEAEKYNAECSSANLVERLRVSESTVGELHKPIASLGKAEIWRRRGRESIEKRKGPTA